MRATASPDARVHGDNDRGEGLGVTVPLHVLESAGLIQSRRGRVIILDRHKVEEMAGDDYGRLEAEYRQLIAPFGKDAPRITPA